MVPGHQVKLWPVVCQGQVAEVRIVCRNPNQRFGGDRFTFGPWSVVQTRDGRQGCEVPSLGTCRTSAGLFVGPPPRRARRPGPPHGDGPVRSARRPGLGPAGARRGRVDGPPRSGISWIKVQRTFVIRDDVRIDLLINRSTPLEVRPLFALSRLWR